MTGKSLRSAFRYPGSKEKIASAIIRRFPDRVIYAALGMDLSCYCEPFIGCGAIAMKVLPRLPRSTRVVFGDKDIGIVSLWRAVRDHTQELCLRLFHFQPSVDEFYRLKELDGSSDASCVELAFRKFALHQMSFSGLGAKAGGPIGGQKQRSDYAVDCRFRGARHARTVSDQGKLLSRFEHFEVIHGDFEKSLSCVPDDGFAYLDPPYYQQGSALYVHDMDDFDHMRLATVLRDAKYDWTLSYDDHERIRGLYASWSDIHTFAMTATIDTKRGAGNRRKNNELVIVNRD